MVRIERFMMLVGLLGLVALDGSATGCKSNSSDGARSGGAAGSSGAGGAAGAAGGAGAWCPATGVSKRPWALRVDGASALVRWEACREGTSPTVNVTPEGGGATKHFDATSLPFTIKNTYTAPLNPSAPPDRAGTYYMHEAKLEGLAAGTCYAYSLGADATMSGRVCTARPAGASFSFAAIADTNPGLGDSMKNVAAHIAPLDWDFMLHGGDIQYYKSGLETWQSWFPIMAPVLAHGAFQPSVGNHESEKPDEYDDYFIRFFGGAGFDGTDGYYRLESGGVWFFALDTEDSLDAGSTQVKWFEEKLEDASKRPGYRFSVVIMHRPLLTCGDTAQLDDARALLEPLFVKYQVPFVLQGHMHGYERFEVPVSGGGGKSITYMTVAGGGGALGDIDENVARPTCGMRVSSGAFRFASIFAVKPNAVEMQTIGADGAVRDSFSKAMPW
ncbi:MAG: metallophosphoesterase family protein [Sorangiineae bacterium]|nr:metallophosphoesterase family protein [Polyangiaceae bacterium]MEB2324493.1 metallophosphoesterase family protein [Sorangiineae bacterium]